ncbi:MAG: hypothetical protein KBF15_10930 [Parabacteroides sp.]|jgi:hypothetical protein|nr:hypothetical protein [Parabacteroides sp.]OJV37030.1 MAG: hypothetical protein BGO29_02675 [Bacteroidales bacterium 36-12]
MNKARRIIKINEFSMRGVSTINTEYAIDAVNETAKQWRELTIKAHREVCPARLLEKVTLCPAPSVNADNSPEKGCNDCCFYMQEFLNNINQMEDKL